MQNVWCFLHNTGEKLTLVDFFSIECGKMGWFPISQHRHLIKGFVIHQLKIAFIVNKDGKQKIPNRQVQNLGQVDGQTQRPNRDQDPEGMIPCASVRQVFGFITYRSEAV